jgi:hypothetical protein
MHKSPIAVAVFLVCFPTYAENQNPQEPAPPNNEAVAPVPTEAESVCATITCSNHGVCIETEGKPTCACNDGYGPDTVNGLSCLPVTSAPALSAATMNTALLDAEREAALAKFYSVLPKYPAERSYAAYMRVKAHGVYPGDFNDYMANQFGRKKAGGVVMAALGGVFLVAGTVLIPLGVNAESIVDECAVNGDNAYYGSADDLDTCTDPDDVKLVFLLMGSVLSISSVALLAVGIPKAVIGASRLKAVNTLRTKPQKPIESAPVSNLNVSLIMNHHTGMRGLSWGLTF